MICSLCVLIATHSTLCILIWVWEQVWDKLAGVSVGKYMAASLPETYKKHTFYFLYKGIHQEMLVKGTKATGSAEQSLQIA